MDWKRIQSATKIVLLMFAISMCIWLFTWQIESKDFMQAIMLVLAFYFGQKSLPNNK